MKCYCNLKEAFVVIVIIVFSGICVFTFLEQSEPPRYISRRCHKDNINHHLDGHENQSKGYLWRPYFLFDDCHTFGDRIGAQLKWTKEFFENRRTEQNISGKNVLLMFGRRRQFWSTGNQIQCPGFSINSSQCKLTSSKSLSGDWSLGDFDALIYTDDSDSKPWKLRVPNHIKEIFYTQEAPYSLLFKNKDSNSLWSSYGRGSDIVVSYAKWVAFDDENAKYFNLGPAPSLSLPPKDYAEEKTGFLVIFSSNCDTNNDRLKYVSELQKYVPVDVFGKCGTMLPSLSCQRGTADAGSRQEQQQCLDSVVSKYKFYLAFENSNCRDYITEKFFVNALKNDVVPVVMGAHPEDYKYAAPPHSYIHVEDFQSPRHLAKHLVLLDRNRTLYNDFFLWKGTGAFYNPTVDLFCRLCGMLFYSDVVPPQRFSKENATWANVDTCLPRGQWYWDR